MDVQIVKKEEKKEDMSEIPNLPKLTKEELKMEGNLIPAKEDMNEIEEIKERIL